MEIACGKHRWKRATGSAMEDNPGNRLRKAWVEERNGKRSGGNIVEIASEKHRWIRDAGRDGRCGWEIGWEKWKERYAGQIGELACEKHQWRRGTRRGTCDRAVGNIGGGEAREALWKKNHGNKKSWKELAKSICGEEVREETDAAVRKYVKKSGRSAMEDKSWK